MYQLPLALAAVQAQSVIRGEGTLDEMCLNYLYVTAR